MIDRPRAGHRISSAGALLAVAVGIGACTGASSPAASASSAASAVAEASSDPTSTPLPGLPAELVGSWETDLRDFYDEEDEEVCAQCGPQARLIIRPHGQWAISRNSGQASGRFTVQDGRIIFERIMLAGDVSCGTGAYTWHVEGDTLTLTAVEADGCARRNEALNGPTYTRVD